MPRFFIDEVTNGRAVITGKDAKHITGSLRMRVGDSVVLCDKNEVEHFCTISSMGDSVELEVNESAKSEAEPNVDITLYQALPKGDKMEFIIQKSVELGVKRIVPVLTSRCISRPDQKSMEKKIARYQKISEEAAKQCGRATIPEVCGLLNFADAIKSAKSSDCAMIFYELGGARAGDILNKDAKSVSVIIGSEGGFSEEEIASACDSGINTATLGKRILRCETAPVAALSVLMYLTGNM